MNRRTSDIQMASQAISQNIKSIHEFLDNSAQELIDHLYSLHTDDLGYLNQTRGSNGSLFAQTNRKMDELKNIILTYCKGTEDDFGVNPAGNYMMNPNRTLIQSHNGTYFSSPSHSQKSVTMGNSMRQDEFIGTMTPSGNVVLTPVKRASPFGNGSIIMANTGAYRQDILGDTQFSHVNNLRARTTYLNATMLQSRSPDRKHDNPNMNSLINQRMLKISKLDDGSQNLTIYGPEGITEFTETIIIPLVGSKTGKYKDQVIYSNDKDRIVFFVDRHTVCFVDLALVKLDPIYLKDTRSEIVDAVIDHRENQVVILNDKGVIFFKNTITGVLNEDRSLSAQLNARGVALCLSLDGQYLLVGYSILDGVTKKDVLEVRYKH